MVMGDIIVREPMQNNRCNAISSNKKRCKAKPLKGKYYCFFHQPDREISRRAQIKGGKKGKRRPNELIELNYIDDIKLILQETINKIRSCSGSELAKARVIGYIVSILLRYFEIMKEIKGDIEIIEPSEKEKRRGFVEEAFAEFPEDVQKRLLSKLKDMKHEVLIRFARDIAIAKQELREGEKA